MSGYFGSACLCFAHQHNSEKEFETAEFTLKKVPALHVTLLPKTPPGLR